MNKEKAERRIENLRQEIHRYNYHYYVKDSPLISDGEYDALMRELQELETLFPELRSPDSPTQRVGSEPVKAFGLVRHRRTMLSLDNAMNTSALRDFDAGVRRRLGQTIDLEYIFEPKLDGIAVELVYEQGILIVGSTRG